MVQIVGRYEIVINVGIASISGLEVRILILIVQVVREVVGNGDELSVERLLQILKVLDGVLEEEFVFQAIAGSLITGSVVVTGIEEVLIAKVLINVVPVPKTGDVPVEDCTGVAGPLV